MNLNLWDFLSIVVVSLILMIICLTWIVSGNARRVTVAQLQARDALNAMINAAPAATPAPVKAPAKRTPPAKHRTATVDLGTGEILGEHPHDGINQTGQWAPAN